MNIEIKCCGGQEEDRNQCLKEKCIVYQVAKDAIESDRGFGPSDVYDLTPEQHESKVYAQIQKIIEKSNRE